MTWSAAGVAIGGASLVSGIMGSRSAKKLQKQQLALQQKALQFNIDRYNQAKDLYGGVIEQTVKDAQKGVTADLGGVTSRAVGDINQQFDNAQQTLQRNQTRMGINPNSGRAESAARGLNFQKALGTAGAVTTGRENERRYAETQTRALRQNAASLGVNQMNGTAAGVDNATQSMASAYGNMATQQAQQAQGMFAGAGQVLGDLMATRSATPVAATGGTFNPPAITIPQTDVVRLNPSFTAP